MSGASSVYAQDSFNGMAIPPMGEVPALTNNQPSIEFFTKRKENKECQARLSDLEKAEAETYAEMKRLKAKGDPAEEIDFKETEWRAARKDLLEVVEECGPCLTAEVRKIPVATTARKEVWYIADGVCQAMDDSSVVEKGYEKAAQSLTQVAGYGKRTGGFDPMIEFLPFNVKSGELIKGKVEISPFPFHAFVGLKAGEFLGATLSFRHLMEISWNEKTGAKKETQVVFKGIPIPRNVVPPDVNYETESGQSKRVSIFPSSAVNATFYLNSTGYARYYMAGELGGNIPFAATMGRTSARDALYTLYKRFSR